MSVHIGTSGWHYKHWIGPFYPADMRPPKMLRWYAERFDTVEINNSFYRLPALTAFETWCRETTPDFCFAVKASRYITHSRKLTDPVRANKKFISLVERLGSRLGPILFQLPASWKVNAERLDGFISGLPRTHRYVFEFRNPTWNDAAVYEVLRRHNVAFCIYELAGFQPGFEVTTDFTYVRLHGPGRTYQGDYSDRILQSRAKRIDGWRSNLQYVFIYFDNDQAGFAPKNALRLKQMVG